MTSDTTNPTASTTPFAPRDTPLSATEARVLATLMEKARTVPDTYPLSLNALQAGCNQKTSRDPVTHLNEAEILAALDALRTLGLINEVSGSRVRRFAHNALRVWAVPDQSGVLLALLMLRGPQTAGELRLNAERWHRFADISSVEAFLDELANRPAEKGGPLVALLPRAPGMRESRWAQLLTGPAPENGAVGAEPAGADAPPHQAALQALEERVSSLEKQLRELQESLGLSQNR